MRFFSLLILLLFASWQVQATHNRSGEMTYRHISGNTYEIRVVTFTEPASVAADRPELEVHWGDGTIDTVPRVQEIILDAHVKMNVYIGTHTYGGFDCYVIGMQDLNRVAGINNINNGASVEIPFFLEDSICLFDPSIWGPPNNSVQTTHKAIDTAFVNEVYYHTMGAYDPDFIDSLHFSFYVPEQDAGFPVTNYQTLPEAFPGTTLTIDPNTGVITWDSPPMLGLVNVGIRVEEFRRRYNPDGTLIATRKIGSLKRDLQIFILEAPSNPPVIAEISDTCVLAGSVLNIPVHVTDADVGQTITVSGIGGPFQILESPATLDQTPPTGTSFWNGEFQWNTVCNHSQPGYYQVLINAQDNTGASDIETFGIKVVAPPPLNLTATPSGNSVVLNWDDPYVCAGASRFLGFSIWRREGPNPFAIDTCTPGLAGKGYVKIASGHQPYSYTDNNVEIGRDYCYRVLAEFGNETSLGWVLNFVESLPSNEACSQLKRDLPVMTKVSVVETDQNNGTMQVEWTNPNLADFDTIQNPGPYRYKLYRTQGFNLNADTILIHTSTPVLFSQLSDTSFLDTGLNTADNPYTYFVKFYGDTLLGETAPASSVYLNVTPAGNLLTLNWEANVPWTNYEYVIFKSYPPGSPYVVIDTVTTTTYTDAGLKNDSLYCYYVQSIGAYSDTTITAPLLNDSEKKCGVPLDTVGPCPPLLVVSNVCTTDDFIPGDFINLLRWSKPQSACGGDAIKYYIFYSPSAEQAVALIDTLHLINDTTFQHQLQNTVAGCYAVAAVDSYYNVGPLSNLVCLDNCPVYQLPNTFTPNGDGSNDVFHPVLPYRFVQKVNMKIFTSWGSRVFETNDPDIGWNGINAESGKEAPEGTYYYVCEVFEQRLSTDGKPDITLNGFIHLFR